jgi:hypothetical protein
MTANRIKYKVFSRSSNVFAVSVPLYVDTFMWVIDNLRLGSESLSLHSPPSSSTGYPNLKALNIAL